MPPTAAPMTPPFTLFLLVVAPMIAPAAAPMAASRCVCFTVTSPPALDDVTVPPLDVVVRVPELRRRVVLVPADVEDDVRRGAAAAAAPVPVPASAAALAARSAAVRLSSG